MKTLINKANPQIRITAPEIYTSSGSKNGVYYDVPEIVDNFWADDWTLVDEEPEVDLEKEAKKIAYEVCKDLPPSEEKDNIVYYAILAAIEGIKGNLEGIPSNVEKAADISANEVYPPMIEVYPRIPNSTCVEFKQEVIDHNAYNRMLHIEGFKAGVEWMAEKMKGNEEH